MTRGLVAKLPDGTISTMGWALWIAAALFAGVFVSGWGQTLGLLLRGVVYPMVNASPVVNLGLTLVTLTPILVLFGRFATVRLLMPQPAWLALAAFPAAVVYSRSIGGVEVVSYVGSLIAVAAAFVIIRFWPAHRLNGATSEQALQPDASPSVENAGE